MHNEPKLILNELLVDIFNQILSIQQDRLRKEGIPLSLSEIHVLEAIQKVTPPTMSLIAKKLRITVGTLTTAVKRLVKKGYVSRYQDEADRRKVYVKLTPSALEILNAHEGFHQEMIEAVLKETKDHQIPILIHSLSKLLEFFKTQS
jgi:DNA-binding MarR family transcriptional regulator